MAAGPVEQKNAVIGHADSLRIGGAGRGATLILPFCDVVRLDTSGMSHAPSMTAIEDMNVSTTVNTDGWITVSIFSQTELGGCNRSSPASVRSIVRHNNGLTLSVLKGYIDLGFGNNCVGCNHIIIERWILMKITPHECWPDNGKRIFTYAFEAAPVGSANRHSRND